jgi:SAM-dependent methyltransferase
MIARARSAYPQIRFQVGSAEELNVEGNRDVISMLFHVMSYHVSDAAIDAALQRIGPRLSSSGVFVFDFWHSGGVTRDPPGFRVRETRVDGRPLFRVTTPTEDRAQHLIAVQYDFRWDSTDGPLVHTETHTMRHFTARELTVFLAAAGMEPIRCEGWMSGSGLSELDWYGCMYARRRPLTT